MEVVTLKKKPIKVCFVGGLSCGKTVLSDRLNSELNLLGFNSKKVGEFATYYIQHFGYPKEHWEQILIFQGQKENEEAIKNCDFIICDGASWVAYVYAIRFKPDLSDKEVFRKYLHLLGEVWRWSQESILTYDYIFFLPLEFEVKEDGVRYNIEYAEEISQQIKGFLDSERIKYYIIKGSLGERVKQVLEIILKDKRIKRS